MRDRIGIEGHKLRFVRGSGWQCDCRSFAEHRRCEHVQKAVWIRNLDEALLDLRLSSPRLQ